MKQKQLHKSQPTRKSERHRVIIIAVPERAYMRWLKQRRRTFPNPATGLPYTDSFYHNITFRHGMLADLAATPDQVDHLTKTKKMKIL